MEPGQRQGRTPRAYDEPPSWTQVVAKLDDGRIALEDGHGFIVLWDPRSGRHMRTVNLEREESALGCVTLLPDGRLAVGMGDGPIRLWRLARSTS